MYRITPNYNYNHKHTNLIQYTITEENFSFVVAVVFFLTAFYRGTIFSVYTKTSSDPNRAKFTQTDPNFTN